MSATTLPLFHGTRADLHVGDALVPGAELGITNHADASNAHVFVTTSIGLAQMYADVATGDGQCRVVRVETAGPLEVDDLPLLGARSDAYTCPSAMVVEVIDVW